MKMFYLIFFTSLLNRQNSPAVKGEKKTLREEAANELGKMRSKNPNDDKKDKASGTS